MPNAPQRVYWLRFSAFRGGDGLIIHSGDGFKAIFAGEQVDGPRELLVATQSANDARSLTHHSMCSSVFKLQTPLEVNEFEPETYKTSCYWSNMGSGSFRWLHKPIAPVTEAP
ncbi:hypothetical protein N7519_009316 [Penicillium mononematosum]|uniref:uncharacterized protein n=1 Tax=Penicillium mononematosum TaxID=268346 RepID=UPI002546F3C4|nr:uncharacterized protein N7519_009316 [Penicillium mononematosum]KAJ6178855.1 hypothetical protein N7519_009316 [Penicillium mononematosum]